MIKYWIGVQWGGWCPTSWGGFFFLFFYQSTIITFVQTKTNNKKLKKNYKKTVDETLHYLIAICNVQKARAYKMYRYFNLSQIL